MSGALYAGLSTAGPPRPAVEPHLLLWPDLLLWHLHGLASAWRTTGATPDAMRLAAQRLADRGQALVAAHCRRVADEESGHDALAWKDMEALGLPVAAFVERLQPATSMALAVRLRMLAASEDPIAVLGYAYALERSSLKVTAEAVARVEAALPVGVFATRCLRVHSAVGGDAGHVAESLAVIAQLAPRDRVIVARETFETARIIGEGADYPGDGAMRDLLASLGWGPIAAQRPAA